MTLETCNSTQLKNAIIYEIFLGLSKGGITPPIGHDVEADNKYLRYRFDNITLSSLIDKEAIRDVCQTIVSFEPSLQQTPERLLLADRADLHDLLFYSDQGPLFGISVELFRQTEYRTRILSFLMDLVGRENANAFLSNFNFSEGFFDKSTRISHVMDCFTNVLTEYYSSISNEKAILFLKSIFGGLDFYNIYFTKTKVKVFSLNYSKLANQNENGSSLQASDILPTHIRNIRQTGSSTACITFDNDWEFSFRVVFRGGYEDSLDRTLMSISCHKLPEALVIKNRPLTL